MCAVHCTSLCVDCNNCWVHSHCGAGRKITPPSRLLCDDWVTQLIPSYSLVPLLSSSHFIGPPGVVAWLHQKLIYLSRGSRCLLQHFTGRVRQHAFSVRSPRTFRGPHRMHPGNTGSTGRPAVASKCSPGIASILVCRPTRHWNRGSRCFRRAGSCTCKRCVAFLTGKKTIDTEIVPSLVRIQVALAAGYTLKHMC